MRRLLLALSLAALPPSHGLAAPGTLISSAASGTFSAADVNRIGRVLYARVNEPRPRYAVKRYDLRVRSKGEQGQPITVRAQLFVPQLPAAQKLPVYVLGAGTTGLADECSVFNERPEQESWGWYQGHMLSYAAQGFIGVMPDYDNFRDPARLQPYFVSASEARILLDAARAGLEFFQGKDEGATPARAVFFSGYSQGGHSSFAAADLRASYAPELPVRGVVVFGGTQDVGLLWRENAAFAPYTVASYAQYYGKNQVDPARILLPKVNAGLRANAETRCIGDLYEMYSKRPQDVFRPEFLAALRGGSLSAKYPGVARALTVNSAGLAKSATAIPAFVAQGAADDIITAKSARAFAQKLCKLGRQVTYREYRGINHYQTRQVAVGDAMQWMKDVTAGKPVPDTCP